MPPQSDASRPARERRSQLLVDPEVQSSLVRRILIHWCIFVGTTFVLVGLMQACIEHPQGSWGEILGYVLAKNALALLVAVALIPVFVYDTIKVTNRFAGPIARLRGMLRSLAEGEEINDLNLRKGDFWRNLADEFSRAVAQLKQTPRGT
ncbi:MAG TPA: hypothetical protein VIY86_00245 [Pirellulaceae bacterium]